MKLIPTWNTCGSASSTAVRRVMKFSGAKNRQPWPRCSQNRASIWSRMCASWAPGPSAGPGWSELEEPVALAQAVARSWADRPASTTRKRPTRDTSRQQCRNEFSVCSVRSPIRPGDQADDHLGRRVRRRPGVCTSASGYADAASIIVGTQTSRLPAILCRSSSGMSGRASRRRHSVNASACLPIQDAHTACSSVARQA